MTQCLIKIAMARISICQLKLYRSFDIGQMVELRRYEFKMGNSRVLYGKFQESGYSNQLDGGHTSQERLPHKTTGSSLKVGANSNFGLVNIA